MTEILSPTPNFLSDLNLSSKGQEALQLHWRQLLLGVGVDIDVEILDQALECVLIENESTEEVLISPVESVDPAVDEALFKAFNLPALATALEKRKAQATKRLDQALGFYRDRIEAAVLDHARAGMQSLAVCTTEDPLKNNRGHIAWERYDEDLEVLSIDFLEKLAQDLKVSITDWRAFFEKDFRWEKLVSKEKGPVVKSLSEVSESDRVESRMKAALLRAEQRIPSKLKRTFRDVLGGEDYFNKTIGATYTLRRFGSVPTSEYFDAARKEGLLLKRTLILAELVEDDFDLAVMLVKDPMFIEDDTYKVYIEALVNFVLNSLVFQIGLQSTGMSDKRIKRVNENLLRLEPPFKSAHLDLLEGSSDV